MTMRLAKPALRGHTVHDDTGFVQLDIMLVSLWPSVYRDAQHDHEFAYIALAVIVAEATGNVVSA